MSERILVAADGSCITGVMEDNRRGPGAWAAWIVDGYSERMLSGSVPDTSSFEMEFRAAIEGLHSLADGAEVDLLSDHSGVQNAFDRFAEGTAPVMMNGKVRLPGRMPARLPRSPELYVELLAEVSRMDVRVIHPEGKDLVDVHARAHVVCCRMARDKARELGFKLKHSGPRAPSPGYSFSVEDSEPVVSLNPRRHLHGCSLSFCVEGCPVKAAAEMADYLH